MGDRTDLILQYFRYLVSDYDFIVVKKEFSPSMMGNAFVVFASSKIGIEVVIDRDQVLIAMGDQSAPRDKWFDFSYAYQYFSNSTEQGYIFPKKTKDNTWDEIVEIQLRRLADLLRQYCDPLLKGDLSMQGKIEELAQNYSKNLLEHLRQIAIKSQNNKAINQ